MYQKKQNAKSISMLCVVGMSLLFVHSSCQFNQSIEKDLTTGAVMRGDGIGCDELKLAVNGAAADGNRFTFGDKVTFSFENLVGFKRVDNMAYPKMSMYIVKNDKDTVLAYPELLQAASEGTDLDPLRLDASFTAVLPYINQESFKALLKISDAKGSGTLSYELPFTVEADKELSIATNKLGYEHIYLWNQSQEKIVSAGKVKQSETLLLMLEGISGMREDSGRVYPALSLQITDKDGRQIITRDNLLKQYTEEGLDAKTFAKGKLPVSIQFTAGQIQNPCTLKALFRDSRSDGEIQIERTITVL